MIVCVRILFTGVVIVIQRHARNDKSIRVRDDPKVSDDNGKVPQNRMEWLVVLSRLCNLLPST